MTLVAGWPTRVMGVYSPRNLIVTSRVSLNASTFCKLDASYTPLTSGEGVCMPLVHQHRSYVKGHVLWKFPVNTLIDVPLVNSLRPSGAYMRSDLTSIGSDNGLSPGQNRCCNIVNKTLWNKLQWVFSRILIFSFEKMRLKVSSAKRRPFCLGLNELSELEHASRGRLIFF